MNAKNIIQQRQGSKALRKWFKVVHTKQRSKEIIEAFSMRRRQRTLSTFFNAVLS